MAALVSVFNTQYFSVYLVCCNFTKKHITHKKHSVLRSIASSCSYAGPDYRSIVLKYNSELLVI